MVAVVVTKVALTEVAVEVTLVYFYAIFHILTYC